MKRIVLLGLLITVPAVAAAQVPPPPPPAPATPAAPPPAAAPMPPLPPTPMVIVPPVLPDQLYIEDSVRAAVAAAREIDVQAIRESAERAAELAREDARGAAEQGRQALRLVGPMMPALVNGLPMRYEPFFQDRMMTMGMQDSESSSYSAAMSLLLQTPPNYEQAIMRFDRTIAQKGPHADGAWYWKALSQYKLGKTEDAIASIAALRKDYPQSKYLKDASVLENDVRKPRPETIDGDDELKLLAIQGIQNSDPVKAAQLAGTILSGSNSLQLKRRALYILALSDQPSAHDLLLNYAKGNGNPDLQREAINYLATRRTKQPTTSNDLRQIYESTQDPTIRRAIIDAYRTTGDKASLITVASTKGEPPDIRSQAIRNLSDVAAPTDLWTLYQKEENKDLRIWMVRAFSSMGAVDQLLQIAKSDKDPEVRQQAVRSLGNQKVDKTGTTLVDMYSSETDKNAKMAIISALGNQNNDVGLVAIARKETKDLDLKKAIVSRLMEMAGHSKVATDYLMEVLGK